MTAFVCVFGRHGQPVTDGAKSRYEAALKSLDLTPRWHAAGPFAALIGYGGCTPTPEVATVDSSIGVGIVRLDNREELQRLLKLESTHMSDLELVIRLLSRGHDQIVSAIGDFACVVWNQTNRSVVAARDALGVRSLFYSVSGDAFCVASRGDLLVSSEDYDVQYFAELVAYCPAMSSRTAYPKVHAVPAGFTAVLRDDQVHERQYWSPYDFQPDSYDARNVPDAIERCRLLLCQAVRQRLTDQGETWAQLSGGLDSSSVVSIAQWMVRTGELESALGGSVTWTDASGMGADEREYSDAVASQYGLRNEQLVDVPLWAYDGCPPPHTDQPTAAFASYGRWRRLGRAVREAGGRVLLTGVGGDELFRGNMLFFADWLALGRIGDATAEMWRRATIGRVSVWDLAFKNAVVPLLPRWMQHRLMGRTGQTPPFLCAQAARKYDLRARTRDASSLAGRRGRKYSDSMAKEVQAIQSSLPAVSLIEDLVEVRHPFLYRPLVEFARRLPPELCVQPHARKWILREALRGILPDKVGRRVGKASTSGLMAAGLIRWRHRLDTLLEDPVLGQLGVVDVPKLRNAFTTVQATHYRVDHLPEDVQYTLSIEAWLQARSGRWPQETGLSRSA